MLRKKYKELCNLLNIAEDNSYEELNYLIKEILADFMKDKQNPAIYCNGIHTNRLMADYVYELKKVKYIIDQNTANVAEGFAVISQDQINEMNIDAVIISSFKFRNQIKLELKKNYSHVKILDLYEELEKQGIYLICEYYKCNHPYFHYQEINSLRMKIMDNTASDDEKKKLLNEYIVIKDFSNAKKYLELIKYIFDSDKYIQVYNTLTRIEELKIVYAKRIAQKNVVMLCCDGLRREDLCESKMPIMYKWMKERTHFFDNAFSFSTSTFESLMPVYSGNYNLLSVDYTKNIVCESDCTFLQVAVRQNRDIFFYTDGEHMIESEKVFYTGETQTIGQKIWDFLCDGILTNKGLFYIHELYETHFSFPSPYVDERMIAEGTNILFDFLPHNGGKLRADYEKQQKMSLRYVDDMIGPILNALKCKVVLFSDHGNLILDNAIILEKVDDEDLLASDTLTHIPLAIFDENIACGEDSTLVSLCYLPEIVSSLLKDKQVDIPKEQFIKIARNELYNPNFRAIYAMRDKEEYIQAFEKFVFQSGEYIYIFADGQVKCSDGTTYDTIFPKVKGKITVLRKE